MSAGPDTRTPEQIRDDIERQRRELGQAVDRLRGEVKAATDWRGFVQRNRQQVLIGAAVAGFLIGGGLAGVSGLFRRK